MFENIKLILIAIIMMHLFDILSTYICMKRFAGKEQNPIARWLINNLGMFFGLTIITFLYIPIFLSLVYIDSYLTSRG